MNRQPIDTPYELFVDGSPGPKKGPGFSGWGIVLMAGTTPVYEACGVTARRMTTNATELEAMIQGISYLLRLNLPTVIPIWSDSQYVVDTMGTLALLGQQEFSTAKGEPIYNAEQIKMLYDLWYRMDMHEHCLIRKVKGHNGVIGNEAADVLSKRAAYKGEIWYQDNRIQINDTD
jgi:ribonuclease HI